MHRVEKDNKLPVFVGEKMNRVPDLIFVDSSRKDPENGITLYTRSLTSFKIELVEDPEYKKETLYKITFEDPIVNFNDLNYLFHWIWNYDCYIITQKTNIQNGKLENVYLQAKFLQNCLPQTCLELTCAGDYFNGTYSFYAKSIREIDLRTQMEVSLRLPVLKIDPESNIYELEWGCPSVLADC